MTILIAIKKNNRVFVGADRITTFGSGYSTDLVDGSKIVKLKHGYLATSGYTLLDNVIEHLFKSNHKLVENPFRDRSDVFTFFLELYNEMKKSYTLVDSGKETYASFYNVFLVVTAHSIYGVSSNLSVHEYDRFAAKGAGSDYALGCLYGCYDLMNDGFEIARLALEAACRYSIYCKEPLDIVEVKESDFGKRRKGSHKVRGREVSTIPKLKGTGNMIAIERGKAPAIMRLVREASNGAGKNGKVAKPTTLSKTTKRTATLSKTVKPSKSTKTKAKATKSAKPLSSTRSANSKQLVQAKKSTTKRTTKKRPK